MKKTMIYQMPLWLIAQDHLERYNFYLYNFYFFIAVSEYQVQPNLLKWINLPFSIATTPQKKTATWPTLIISHTGFPDYINSKLSESIIVCT